MVYNFTSSAGRKDWETKLLTQPPCCVAIMRQRAKARMKIAKKKRQGGEGSLKGQVKSLMKRMTHTHTHTHVCW